MQLESPEAADSQGELPHDATILIPEPTPSANGSLRWNLRAIMADGAAFSVMVGTGESYVSLFALALGLTEITAGLMTTVPILVGAVLQLAAPWGVRRMKSYRRWVVRCACLQAASLLLMAGQAILRWPTAWPLALATTIYWASGLAGGPAWNTWVEEIVPAEIRAQFFAQRARINQLGALIGLVLAGLALEGAAKIAGPILPFVGLFLTAAACRFVSAWFLASQSEPARVSLDDQRVAFRELPRRFFHDPGAKLLTYLFAVQMGVWIAAPYFTPYMRNTLGFTYLQFATLTSLSLLGKMIALPLFGNLAHRTSARWVLWLGGIGITPLAGLWSLSDSFLYLIALQVLAGVVWGAYELAMFLLFFEAIPKHERTSLLTVYNLGNSVAMVAGALLGAALLRWLGPGRTSFLTVFVISSVVRGLALPLLSRVPNMK